MPKIDIVETEEIPICSHCNKELGKILTKEIGILAPHVVYFCSHCKKVLGVTQVGR